MKHSKIIFTILGHRLPISTNRKVRIRLEVKFQIILKFPPDCCSLIVSVTTIHLLRVN